MTIQEFSNTFDTLLNSYNTQAQFGEQASKREIVLDEYEKSVLLTQAQDIIVKSYFDGSLNSQGQGMDDSTRRQMDFSSLIKVAELEPLEFEEGEEPPIFDDRGIIYQMPRKNNVGGTTDVLFILNEKLTQVFTKGSGQNTIVTCKKDYIIVPISYKEYDREMSKPYAQPLKKQAWRLFQNQATGFDINSELIPRFNVTEGSSDAEPVKTNRTFIYKIRYVKRPQPIVLEDLPNDLEIDGVTTESECELNPILHMDILNKAVELAIATRGGGSSSQAIETLNNSQPNR